MAAKRWRYTWGRPAAVASGALAQEFAQLVDGPEPLAGVTLLS